MRDRIKVILFAAFILLFPVLTALLPKEDSSYYENRTLAKWPVFSLESILTRSYFNEAEAYISDHFPYRDDFLTFYVRKELALHAPVINRVVVSGDILLPYRDYIVETYDRDNMQKAHEMLEGFSQFCSDRGIAFLYVGIPEQSSALADSYPDYLEPSAYREHFRDDFMAGLAARGIDYLDMKDHLLTEDVQRYYSKTDHHYNFYGAYETYLQIMEHINAGYFAAPVLTNMTILPVGSDFMGSHSRKLMDAFENDDALYYYETPEMPGFTRYDNGDLVQSRIFDEGQSTIYNYYMGGDIAETIIETNRPELPNALIFGDSFTNPLETLLFHSFNEMRSLDLRHYSEMSIYEYVETYRPDIVICVRDDLSYIVTDGNGNLSR